MILATTGTGTSCFKVEVSKILLLQPVAKLFYVYAQIC